MFKRMFSLSRPVKNVLSAIFYVIFFVYMVKLIIQAPDLSSRLMYAVLLVGVGGVAAWYEAMKAVLQSAIKQAVMYCDREKPLSRLALLEKMDRRQTYAGSDCILRLLLLLDHCCFAEAAQLAEQNAQTVLAQNAELKLVARHTRFVACGELGDLERCAEFYHSACDLRHISVGGKVQNMAPYYSWDQMDAAFAFYSGKYKEGVKAAQKVSDHAMNPREKVQFHYLYARLLHAAGRRKHALDELQLALQNTQRNTDMKELLEREAHTWKTEAD